MDSDQQSPIKTVTTTTSTFRWATNRRRIHLRRRRKLPYVRLGGGKKTKEEHQVVGRRGISLVKILKKIRVRWLKLQYMCMVKKLKQAYIKMIKDLIEAGSVIEAFQHQISLESSFALPITGVSFSNYPSAASASNYRPSLMF